MPIIFFVLFSLAFCEYEIQNNKELITSCRDSEGTRCICHLTLLPVESEEFVIALSSCTQRSRWSTWTEWTDCLNGYQKRTRRCLTGQRAHCLGRTREKRRCNIPSKIPDHVFGHWTQWLEWSACDCTTRTRTRYRTCMDSFCTGCDVARESCPSRCPTIRRASVWTEWIDSGSTSLRFQAIAESLTSNVTVKFKTEKRTNYPREYNWSPWDARRGVALRSRPQSQGDACEVEYQLLSTVPLRSIPSFFLLPISLISLFVGFFSQCCVSRYCCRRRDHSILNNTLYSTY